MIRSISTLILLTPLAYLTTAFVVSANEQESNKVNSKGNWYGGLLYSEQRIDIDCGDCTTLGGTIGFRFNEYFSLESRLSFKLDGIERNYESVYASDNEGNFRLVMISPPNEYKFTRDIDHQISLLMKGAYPLTDDFSVYGLAGIASTKASESGVDLRYDGIFPEGGAIDESRLDPKFYDLSDTHNGLVIGAGINYQLSEDYSLFIDYQIHEKFERSATYFNQEFTFKRKFRTLNIGVNYSF